MIRTRSGDLWHYRSCGDIVTMRPLFALFVYPGVCLELVFHEKRVFELSFRVRGLHVSEKNAF